MNSHLRKTTKADFKEFIRCCKYWQKYLCPEYELFFDHKELKDATAEVHCNKSAGNVEVILSTEIDNRFSIDSIAFHEMLEVTLHRYFHEASHYLTKDCLHELYAEINHEVIRKLENMVFDNRRDARRR